MQGSPEESLAFHASDREGRSGYVLLLSRPDAEGWVCFLRWESPDYTAAAREDRRPASEIRAAVAREARAGWRFTLPVERVLEWLGSGEGTKLALDE